ncbi:zinc-binding alcohol dehydrogenase family protein [Aspergillus alliaceus]|uniref:zinc-binding alcohol dehydrogenase family protein n=1 Tax=Petromyces alliaceus TaxID=209559 RepID=UPI0012A6C5C8|nr:chaperonin 10-like protein [Aspergillus alliaceus]KAB8230820.1 chaperonin 10-like protein [Aspergillus alliaceus]
MKEVINLAGPTVKFVDSPIPEPNDDQVLIKVVVSGSNPKDWKIRKGVSQGDDIAGVIEKVGSNVVEFKRSDRVAAFHGRCPGGSYAEYAVAWSHTTFHLPAHISFEGASRDYPTCCLDCCCFLICAPPLPTSMGACIEPIPFIVYGTSTAVGSFAIKMACNGDVVIDHREGVETMVQKIRRSLERGGHSNVQHALDAIIIRQSADILRQLKSITIVGSVHKHPEFENNEELGFVFSRYFTRALSMGSLLGHPFQVRPRGLEGVEEALRDLKAGKASAVKYIFRIADTPGVA